MELWDLYDRDGNKTGETWERKFGNFQHIPEGRYHMVVDILVQHVDGTYLLTKRDMSKDVYPGYWEASAGGSAVSGEEPLEAAKRELLEETGLTALSFELVSHTFREPSHSMFYSYLATVDADKDSVVLQEGETVEYKWVDGRGFLDYVESDLAIQTHNNRYKDIILKIRKELGITEGKNMNITFDIANKSDIDELVRLRIAYMIDDFGSVTDEERAGMEKQLPDYFERKLGTELVAFVARDGEKIVSVAYLHIIEMPANSILLTGLFGDVLSVYTEPEYRGQGLCTKLMQDLVEYGRNRGLGRIDLLATDEGYPIYEKVGFKETEARYRSMKLYFEKVRF